MDITVACKEQLPRIMSLYRELFADMAEIDSARFKSAEQNIDFISNIIAAEDADVLLAKNKDEIVGLALVLEDETPDYSCLIKRKTAVMMDLIVENGNRGCGAGKALLEASKDWAKCHGAEYLQLNVLAQNKTAIEFYKREGLEDTMITMECKL